MTPSDATNKEVVWDTSDTTGKITVSQDGTVSVAKGATKGATATITVRSKDNPEKNATCVVTVAGSTEEAAALNAVAATYEVGGVTVTFTAAGKVLDEGGQEIGTLTYNEDGGTITVEIGNDEYTIGTDADGNPDIDQVTDKDGNPVTVTVKESDPETPENPETSDPEKPVQTTYTVKFYDGETELTALATTVEAGGTVTKPATDPTKDGYTFEGWYTTSALATAYDFTVAVTGDISIYAKWTEDWDGTPTADSWNFVNNASLFTSVVVAANKTSASDGVTYTLSGDVSIKGTDDVLTLTLSKEGTGKATITDGAKDNPNYAVQSAAAAEASKGLRFKYDAIKIAGVKGKVVLSFDYKAAGTGSRDLEVIAGSTQVFKVTTTDIDKHTKDIEINAGSGTDVYITNNNNFWIEAISIAENTAVFAADTNDATANNVATLGLVGTSVTSDAASVATAKIEDGKIVITSVASGNATITVTDAKSKTATIAVEVAGSGAITPAVTKFTRSAPSAEVTSKASSSSATDGAGTVTWDALTDLEWSTNGEDWATAETVKTTISSFVVSVTGTTATVTGLPAGTYYVRGSASDAYAATEAKTVTITVDGAALEWTVIGKTDKAEFTSKAVTLSKSSGIYLPVSYGAGKKVVLSFTVDKESVNADTGSKICGGLAFDDSFSTTTNSETYAVFASNKGISNGSKIWNNGGSSNGYGTGTVEVTVGETTKKYAAINSSNYVATSDVTFTVTFTVGKETASDAKDEVSKVVVLKCSAATTVTDATTELELTKEIKAKEMKVKNSAGTLSTAAVPYIYFGDGSTDSITVSNITLTVDDAAVATSAD